MHHSFTSHFFFLSPGKAHIRLSICIEDKNWANRDYKYRGKYNGAEENTHATPMRQRAGAAQWNWDRMLLVYNIETAIYEAILTLVFSFRISQWLRGVLCSRRTYIDVHIVRSSYNGVKVPEQ